MLSAQGKGEPGKKELEKAYTQAVEEYIKAVNNRDKSVPDTLFFGRNVEFPDIELPASIRNTGIVVLTSEEADRRREHRKSMVFVNLVGWVSKDKAEFILVTFYPGYLHQYDCMVNLKRDSVHKEYSLESVEFKNYVYK